MQVEGRDEEMHPLTLEVRRALALVLALAFAPSCRETRCIGRSSV